MRLLVCGGRDFFDRKFVEDTLDEFDHDHCIDVIIHGDNKSGADALAKRWAITRGVYERPYPADWKRYRNGAGPIRNKQMLDEAFPERVLAFPGREGTADMCKQADHAGVPVIKAVEYMAH